MVLWDEVFREVANEFPDVQTNSLLIDAAAMESTFMTAACGGITTVRNASTRRMKLSAITVRISSTVIAGDPLAHARA